MLSYQTLDFIADCYTPLLLFAFMVVLAKSAVVKQWQALGINVLLLCCGIVLTYGLMFVDSALSIWASLGLDYSTHTAAALVLVLMINRTVPELYWPNSLLFLIYAGLMMYQNYHTLLDIVSTALVIFMFFYLAISVVMSKGARGWREKSNIMGREVSDTSY